MTWATEGTFFVGVVTTGFLFASALLGVAFKLVVQLTRLEAKIDASTTEHQEVLKRIERLEAAVFPMIARMAEGIAHIYFQSPNSKGD